MLLRRFTDIYPKELARDRREFFNSLLGHSDDVLIAEGGFVEVISSSPTSAAGPPPRQQERPRSTYTAGSGSGGAGSLARGISFPTSR